MDSEVISFLEKSLGKIKGPVPRKDVYRFLSFYRISKHVGRKFINMLKEKGIATEKRNGVVFNFNKDKEG